MASDRDLEHLFKLRLVVARIGEMDRAGVAILYVEGTSEDPAHGAHEDFIDFVTEAADEVMTFSGRRLASDAVAYLSRF